MKWTAEIVEDGALRFRIGREGDRLIAEWPGICVFRADPDGVRSELVPAPGADPMLVDKLHRGLTKALIRHLRGEFTLHASAVAFHGVAIACVGPSGAGKSTMAAALVSCPDAEFVADDTLALNFHDDGRIGVHPTERVSWLLPDARAALGLTEPEERACLAREDTDRAMKVPVDPCRLAERESRLAALVILDFDDALAEPRLRRLRGHEAVERLVPSVVRFVVDEPERNRRELEQLSALTRAIPMYELMRPRKLEELEATVVALRTLVPSLEGGIL